VSNESQPKPDPEQQLQSQARVERAKRSLRIAKLWAVILGLGLGLKRATEGDPRLLYVAGALLVWLSISEFVIGRRRGE
tara:strand:+ start:267 stop:503 length:237 start_codon:yes stop_codon:yes gene_type:complete